MKHSTPKLLILTLIKSIMNESSGKIILEIKDSEILKTIASINENFKKMILLIDQFRNFNKSMRNSSNVDSNEEIDHDDNSSNNSPKDESPSNDNI